MKKLKPPEGHETWLDYACETMETRNLHLNSLDLGRNNQWGRVVEREEMREAARAELRALRGEANCNRLFLSRRTTGVAQTRLDPDGGISEKVGAK